MDAEETMNDQATLLSRIGKWFKRDHHLDGDSRLVGDVPPPSTAIETRTTFLRPWAKRDAAIAQLQDGFTTLTDLMGAIRTNLEQQNKRQDDLLNALQQLPAALQSIPESNRVQGEALAAIRQQIEGQNAQHDRLGSILDKISQSTGEQKTVVEDLRNRVADLHKADTTIADYLNNVGNSLKDVSRNSESTSQVLSQMRDNIDARDGQMERVLHRQGVRFTTMLSVAIFLSIAALVAVGIIGYLVMTRPQ